MLYNIFKLLIICIISVLVFNQPALSLQQSDLSRLTSLEMQFFNQSFNNEPVKNRLDRVERIIFGQTYTESENKRIERVTAFANNPKQPIKQQTANNQVPSGMPTQSADGNNTVPKDDSATDYPVITMLENTSFQKSYKGENVYLRLNRLESSVFGSTFPQDSLYNRVDKLKSALNKTSPDDYNNNAMQSNMNASSVFANLSSLELTVFSQTYDGESVQNRLSRLEAKVFGATQAGSSENRLSRLNQNIENSFSANAPNNYSYTNLGGMNQNYSTTTTPSTSGKSQVWEVIKSILFNFLSSGYSNYGSGYYSPYSYGNYGYNSPYSSYSRSSNTNMGAGVHILP